MKTKLNIRSTVVGTLKTANFNYDTTLNTSQIESKKIISLSGYLYTQDFNYETSDNTYIKDIKQTNMLGRKGLSDKQPILGYNLNTVPKIIRTNTGGKNEIWKIIKVSEWQRQIGPYIQEYPADGSFISDIISSLTKTETIILTGNINDNYLINYPQYLEVQPKSAYKLNVDQFLEYYCFETNNTIYFTNKPIPNAPTDILLFGPLASYEYSIQILKKYCQINALNVQFNTLETKQTFFNKLPLNQ